MKNFNDLLKHTLEIIKKENKIICICGDFNYNLLNFEKDKIVNDFINIMVRNSFQPCILKPTRCVKKQKPSLIDNVFLNCIDKKLTSGNILEKITDHMPNFVILEEFKLLEKKHKFKIRDMKKFNKEDYIKDLANIDFFEACKPCDDVNTLFNTFHNKFLEIVDKHAPYKFLSKKEIKLLKKPWITQGIQKSISTKNMTYRRYLKTQDNFWYDRYKYFRDLLNSLIRKSKKLYYKDYFNKHYKSSKKVWSGINDIINSRRKSSSTEIYVNDNGEIIIDQKIVANKFNDFFINVADKLVQKLGKGNTEFQDYLKNPNESSLFLSEIDPGEIALLILKLETKKSSDIYGLSPKLLIFAAPFITQILAKIFNKSFEEGTFPDKLKSTIVFPIHKADSKMITSNYRPISILPIISKILEQIMYKRLTDFTSKFNIISDHQFGFQKKNSTEHAIVDLCSKIVTAIEKLEKPCCVFLDFAKAFDTVNHNILLKKLEHYGIRGVALAWIKSYLTNRQQCTQIAHARSKSQSIKCGVPQGSVLGPLLFLVYINDISESTSIVDFHLFADDTSIFYSNKNLKVLEKDVNSALKDISEWLIANKLSLNVTKSKLLLFNISNQKRSEKINLHINGAVIEEPEYAKYLGVIIDNKLSWGPHIEYTNKKITKGIGILSKLRHFVPESVIKTFYNASIQSHVDYGLTLWGNAPRTHLNKIELSIKKAIRIMSFKNKYEHTLPLFKKMGILPLDKNVMYLQAKFMWKYVNNLHPPRVQNIFKNIQ